MPFVRHTRPRGVSPLPSPDRGKIKGVQRRPLSLSSSTSTTLSTFHEKRELGFLSSRHSINPPTGCDSRSSMEAGAKAREASRPTLPTRWLYPCILGGPAQNVPDYRHRFSGKPPRRVAQVPQEGAFRPGTPPHRTVRLLLTSPRQSPSCDPARPSSVNAGSGFHPWRRRHVGLR